MFEVGAYVVKAGEGVCRIDGEIAMNVPGMDRPVPYFLLVPITNPKVRVYLPVAGEHADVRAVMTEAEARAFLQKIPSVEALPVLNEKVREQLYRDAVRSCDPDQLTAVLKELFRRGRERAEKGKRPTALDERYLGLAEKALFSELGFILSVPEEDLRAMIRGE